MGDSSPSRRAGGRSRVPHSQQRVQHGDATQPGPKTARTPPHDGSSDALVYDDNATSLSTISRSQELCHAQQFDSATPGPRTARTTQHTGENATRNPTCGANAMQHDDWLSRNQEPAQGNRQHPRSPAQREALDGLTPDEEAPDENLTQPDINAQLAAFRKAVARLAGKVARLTSLPDEQQEREQPQASPQATEPPSILHIEPYNDPVQHAEPTGPTTTIGLAFAKIKEKTSNHRVLASSYPHGGPQQIGAASGKEPQRILTSATRGTANKLWDPGPDITSPKHSTPQVITWTPDLNTAYDKVQQLVRDIEPLNHIDPNIPLSLYTDASLRGIGAVLVQTVNGINKVIAHFSKKFSSVQSRWPTIEQEASAIYFSIMHFRAYLITAPFVVHTDHRNLTFILKCESRKVLRWRMELQEFTFTVVHVPGEDNPADYPSRL